MLCYPFSMQVSNRALTTLADALRHRRTVIGSRWRRLPPADMRCWCWPTCAESPDTPGGFRIT